MFSNWRNWPSALWKTLGSRAHQFANFLFGPDPNMPEEFVRLTKELEEANQARQKLASENEGLITANEGLSSESMRVTRLFEAAKVDLTEAIQGRDTALLENEGLNRTNHELTDEMARENTAMAQLEAEYGTQAEELKAALEDIQETAVGYDELRRHVISFLSVYRRGWHGWKYRRRAISLLAEILEETFEVTDAEYLGFKEAEQADMETALSSLKAFINLMHNRTENSPRQEST